MGGWVMNFKQSRYYGSRVEKAKSERGWLSDEEFTRLGRREFRDFRQNQRGNPLAVIGVVAFILLVVAYIF
jgi:hypothetical protein